MSNTQRKLYISCQLCFGLVLCHNNHRRLFNAKSTFYTYKKVLFQTTQFSISTPSNCQKLLFQTIQFSINILFTSIQSIDRTLSGATIPGQSQPGRDDNKGILCIPQIPRITGASPSDCLLSYARNFLGEFYHYAQKQSVYPATPVNMAT